MNKLTTVALATVVTAACAQVTTGPGVSGRPAVEYVMAPGSTVLREECPPAAREEAASPVERYADANRDGKVTLAEAEGEPALLAAFERYDSDADEQLDSGEFRRLVGDSRARRPATGDEDCVPRLER